MTIQEALDWRYAVREFSNQRLSRIQVENLIEATRKSASSYGLQPYKLILIESEETRRQLLPFSYGQQKVLDCSHLIILAAQSDIGDHTVDHYIQNLMATRKVPYEVVSGYADHMKQALASKTDAQKREWAHQQAYIALGTLLAAAALMKIDSCPMTGFDNAAYDQQLGLASKNLTSSSIVALGYRSPSDKSASLCKVRLQREEFLLEI